MTIKKSLITFALSLAFTITSHAQNSVKFGERAPKINITSWIENVPEDKSLEGKFIVLEFWATWCAGCIEAVPHLNELQAQYDPKEVLFLSITDESPEKIERILKRINFETAVVCDDSEITHNGYGKDGKKLRAIPKTILIDKEGIVKWIGMPMVLSKEVLDLFIQGMPIPPIITKAIIDDEGVVVERKMHLLSRPISSSENLDIREATETYKVEKRRNGKITYTNISLKEIYVDIFNQSDVIIPEEIIDIKYSFDYTFNGEVKDLNLETLELEIVNALHLIKKEEAASVLGTVLTIVDRTKLESALETKFSRVSVAGNDLLINGATLKQVEEIINAQMEGHYELDYSEEEKYDFVLNIKNQDTLLESLKSYGILAESSLTKAKKIVLLLKE